MTTLKFGGAERLAVDLSRALSRRGADVVVATDPLDRSDAFTELLEAASIPVQPVDFPRTNPISVLRSSYQLASIIGRQQPDILHAHNPAAGTVAALARLRARRPELGIVTTYHGVRPHRLRLASRVLRSGELVIAVGKAAKGQLLDTMPSDRVVLIENAVSVATSRSRADVRAEFEAGDLPLIVSVGRYAAQKDHALLVESLGVLRRRSRVVRALIVGTGELRPRLQERIDVLGLGESVTLTGSRSDALDLIAACDLVVHTAQWEGLPLVLLETMALGVAIVAVDAIGVDDLVSDGQTGLLVRSRSPEAVADAIELALDDDDLRARVALGGKGYVVAHHSYDKMVDEHVAVYERAIEMRRR